MPGGRTKALSIPAHTERPARRLPAGEMRGSAARGCIDGAAAPSILIRRRLFSASFPGGTAEESKKSSGCGLKRSRNESADGQCQPLIAPTSVPLAKYFWAKGYTHRIGTVVMITADIFSESVVTAR